MSLLIAQPVHSDEAAPRPSWKAQRAGLGQWASSHHSVTTQIPIPINTVSAETRMHMSVLDISSSLNVLLNYSIA